MDLFELFILILLPTVVIVGILYYYIKRLSNENEQRHD